MPVLDISSAKLKDGLLVLEVPVSQTFQWLDGFKPGKYDIKPHKEKRSKDANAYMWTMCGKIAQRLGGKYTKEEVYQRAIKAVGIYKVFPDLKPSLAGTLETAWHNLGVGWVTESDYEQDGVHRWVRAYYGSSSYNTKQMSRLIDYVVEDARSMGIPTEPEENIQSLLREWEEHEQRIR